MKLIIDMTIAQIIDALPSVQAIGSTHVDEVRYKNLQEQSDLLLRLLKEVVTASKDVGSAEYSMNRQGKLACQILDEVKEMLEESGYERQV